MYKVKIIYNKAKHAFWAEMPVIPRKDEAIGIYNNDNEWIEVRVDYVIHEFDEMGKYKHALIVCC